MPAIAYQTPLRTDILRALDIPEPWSFGIADRVRFGELDALAHVNNTAYLSWLENFRINYFKDYGIADYSTRIPRIVLRQIGVDFLTEMRLGAEYVITGRTTSLRTTSFRMDYGIWSEGVLRATGWAVLVNLNDDSSKAPLPETARNSLISRDNPEVL